MSHRNEAARERHRQQLKQQFSLTSIPLFEYPKEKYNLDNHFGWKVLQKCRIGDGGFPPYLLHCVYCDDKPDTAATGRDDKVMYVLYIRGNDGDGFTPVDAKQTQTSVIATVASVKIEPVESVRKASIRRTEVESVASEEPAPSKMIETKPPPAEPTVEKGKNLRRVPMERRKVISDFYYIPIKERVMMRYDIRQVDGTPGEGGVPGGDTAEVVKGKDNKKKKGKGRKIPRPWALRAGAEYQGDEEPTDSEDSSEDEDEEEETKNKFIDNIKANLTNCFTAKTNEVELMDTHTDKNKYLYIPKDRYEKRAYNVNAHQGIGDRACD